VYVCTVNICFNHVRPNSSALNVYEHKIFICVIQFKMVQISLISGFWNDVSEVCVLHQRQRFFLIDISDVIWAHTHSFSKYEAKIADYYVCCSTASVVTWSEFLATDTEVPGSIPGATRFLSSGSGTGSTKSREYN
jgi:hypothetical protein